MANVAQINIPAGIQSGKQLRRRGAGMPVLQGTWGGAISSCRSMSRPRRSLTARQKELLEEFRETETGEECPQSSGFFSKLKEMWEDLG
jgi:molecular chaperone DnaJ